MTFNKLRDFETVSWGSRHRSNHTQKNIPSVVAGHQFLQFGCIGPDTGIFPSQKMWDIQASAWKQTYHFSANVVFTKLPLQDLLQFAFGIFFVLSCSSYFRRYTKAQSLVIKLERIGAQYFHFSVSALEFFIIPGKSDIMKVTGFITASDRFRKLIWFSSGITGALFSASFSCQNSILSYKALYVRI